MTKTDQDKILKNWHLKLVILTGIVTPTITATGAYYGIQTKMADDRAAITERVSNLELESNKTFADKQSLKILDDRTQKIQIDITEIKTLLKTKFR